MSKYDVLLRRAISGNLSRLEVEAVASALESGSSPMETYTLLHILGEAMAIQYRGVVEKYVRWKADPKVAAKALYVLCGQWGLTAEYLEEVRTSLNSHPWDLLDDVRSSAITCAGEYLASHSDPGLLKELVTIFERDPEPETRALAYYALARAVGRASNLPLPFRGYNPENSLDHSIVEAARLRLTEESS